ncbi:MAG TPA: tetratricopeptide repeat protein [Polyangiaceae bacterium]|nr:tetratricopeptide repeat protein [Polyangiaceae bacterium]
MRSTPPPDTKLRFAAAMQLLCVVCVGCGGSAPPPQSAADRRNAAAAEASKCVPDDSAFAEGSAALSRGDAQAALQRLERGLSALEACRPVDTVRLAATLYALGQAHTALRQLDRAQDRFESALKLNRKLYGPVHDYTIETQEMIGVVADYAGHYGDAERAFRNVISALSRRFEENHPDMLRARTNLAINLKLQKRYAEAERLLDAVVPELRQVKLPNGLGHALNALGTIYHHRNDTSRARTAFAESVAALSQSYGAEHPDVATTLFNLCGLEIDEKRYDAAEAVCARSRAIRERAYPADHPQVQSVVARHEEARRAITPR